MSLFSLIFLLRLVMSLDKHGWSLGSVENAVSGHIQLIIPENLLVLRVRMIHLSYYFSLLSTEFQQGKIFIVQRKPNFECGGILFGTLNTSFPSLKYTFFNSFFLQCAPPLQLLQILMRRLWNEKVFVQPVFLLLWSGCWDLGTKCVKVRKVIFLFDKHFKIGVTS